jgi:hypothetical protein
VRDSNQRTAVGQERPLRLHNTEPGKWFPSFANVRRRPGRNKQRGKSFYSHKQQETVMNQIIWIVGAVVIVIAILGFLGLG